MVTSAEPFPVGTELRFVPNYSALLRAMTSPFVDKRYVTTPVQRAEPPRAVFGAGAA